MIQQLKVLGLFTIMTLLFMGIGLFIGGAFVGNPLVGMSIFLIIIIPINFVSYFWSDKIVLKAYKARIVTEQEAPRLFRIVRELSQASGLPMPRVAIVPSETPNAFATGRNPKNAVVAATVGILAILDDDRELKGVMAHEMSHVKNRDILVMSVAATMAGFIAFAARIYFWSSMFGGRRQNILVVILVYATAFFASMAVQMAISRSREYKADASAAQMTNDPGALASALNKLENGNRSRPMKFGSPTYSSLFIANPFSGSRSFFSKMFSTHPPMDDRIRKLQSMAYGQQPMQ